MRTIINHLSLSYEKKIYCLADDAVSTFFCFIVILPAEVYTSASTALWARNPKNDNNIT